MKLKEIDDMYKDLCRTVMKMKNAPKTDDVNDYYYEIAEILVGMAYKLGAYTALSDILQEERNDEE
jgi:GTP1/Obg family GTP-binding protein